MFRSIAILIPVLMLTGLSAAPDRARATPAATEVHQIFALENSTRRPEFLNSLGLQQPTAAAAQQGCCKICTQGKACGNTCIARDKQCHVGPGCACDG